MLSDRERHSLELMERQLRESDPRFVALFRSLDRIRPRGTALPAATARSMHGAGVMPSVMLAVGLVTLLVGAAAQAMTLVVAGVVVALLTLGVALTRTMRYGPGFA